MSSKEHSGKKPTNFREVLTTPTLFKNRGFSREVKHLWLSSLPFHTTDNGMKDTITAAPLKAASENQLRKCWNLRIKIWPIKRTTQILSGKEKNRGKKKEKWSYTQKKNKQKKTVAHQKGKCFPESFLPDHTGRVTPSIHPHRIKEPS